MVVKMLPIARLARLAPVALAIVALGAQAQATGDSPFTFSGFATLGVVQTDNDAGHYVISGQPRGATTSASGEVDSKVGVQGTYKFNKMFSATAQVLSKQNGDGNFTPELEWAFAKAQITPGLSVRVGRMGGPFFAVSDFRDVGYANIWLRPPQDVYGQVPVSRFDGADVIYQMPLGSSTVSVQVFGGRAKGISDRTDLTLKKLFGVNLTAELENGLALRFGHAQGKLTVESASLNQLVGVLRTTPFASVGNELDANNKDASFTGIGASYDQNNLIASFEYTKRKTDSYVPSTTGWYTTLGYRFGKVAPYVTLSQVKTDDSNVNNTIPTGVNVQLTTLKLTVDGVVSGQALNQKTTAVGVRWDVWRNIALKAQYENVRPEGPGLFANTTANFGKDKVNVYSVAADFVF